MNTEEHHPTPKPEIISFSVQLAVIAALVIAFHTTGANDNNFNFWMWLLTCTGASVVGSSLSVVLLWRFSSVDGQRIAFSAFASLVLWLPAYAAFWPWLVGGWIAGAVAAVIGNVFGLVVSLAAVRLVANRKTDA